MKDKTRKRIGHFLIAIIVILIVLLFSVWYYGRVVGAKEEWKELTQEANEVEKQEKITNETIKILTREELNIIAEKLNNKENNPFVVTLYNNVAEADISEIFYNGAGIATTKISESEKMQLTAEAKKDMLKDGETYSDDILTGDILKLKRTDVEKYWREKTGIKRTFSKTKEGFDYYLEKEDSYYLIRTDTNTKTIYCEEGLVTTEGVYEIQYKDLMSEDNAQIYTVKLKIIDGEFIFISNVKN